MANQKVPQTTTATDNLIAAWRTRMGYSRADGAEALGCTLSELAGWESGKQPIPRYIKLACMALALGIGDEEMKP